MQKPKLYLVIEQPSGRVSTGLRVFDKISVRAAFLAISAGCFGRCARSKVRVLDEVSEYNEPFFIKRNGHWETNQSIIRFLDSFSAS